MAALLIIGCTCPEGVIRYREIPIVPAVMHDTVYAQILDTVVLGEKITKTDTVVQIKYYPKQGYFDFTAKPDTIIFHDIDTLSITKTVVEEYAFENKVYLTIAGFVLGLILMAIILRRKI